jgi:hypothetical protein
VRNQPAIALFDGNWNQCRLLFSMRATPVVQSGHRHTVLGAILAPCHATLCKSFSDLQNLFLASHLVIFSGTSDVNKMGSSDAYGEVRRDQNWWLQDRAKIANTGTTTVNQSMKEKLNRLNFTACAHSVLVSNCKLR